MIKYCSICKEEKHIGEFHKLKHGKLGRHSNCKSCRSNYNKNIKYEKPLDGKLKCLKCHQIRDISEFYRDKSASTGVQSYCAPCHKEKIYESQSKLSGYIAKIYNNLLISCKKMKQEVDITKEDIMEIYLNQNKKCALSNELLTYYSGPSLTDDKYESKFNICIDKIENSKAYQKNNVQLIGQTIYRMKNSLDTKEFIRLCGIVSNWNKN